MTVLISTSPGPTYMRTYYLLVLRHGDQTLKATGAHGDYGRQFWRKRRTTSQLFKFISESVQTIEREYGQGMLYKRRGRNGIRLRSKNRATPFAVGAPQTLNDWNLYWYRKNDWRMMNSLLQGVKSRRRSIDRLYGICCCATLKQKC